MLSEILQNRVNIVRLLAYLIGVFAFTIIIHEYAHVISALMIGVPLNEIELGWIGINPGVTLPSRFSSIPLDLFYYSGGFFTAFVLVCIYYLVWYRKYRNMPSFINWAYGAITMTFIGVQLGQGYLEGRFHSAYMFYADSLFNVGSILVYGFFILAMLYHFKFFPIQKILGQKRKLKQVIA